MKISRLSPRYEEELLDIADTIDAAIKQESIHPISRIAELERVLRDIAKDLRFMVSDNDRFLNS
jgi:hypothetical protein